ncbi:class II fructose-bisphosphate aldolase [Actinophytocola sp.]|uniref:class II fructose-bisphosphate aldolase n=1 Tax=Actinophytocola sp. TaxID=1872138 RepID=UPI003D6AC54B
MPLELTGKVVKRAEEAGRGIGAFNAICVEHAEAIATGAEAAGRPAIIQISENAVRFHGGRLGPIAAACSAVARASSADLALHLDHVESPELLREAGEHAFGSVMVDASKLPYAANIEFTREAVRWAHARGLWVEAELGEVGGKDGVHAPGVRTDPHEAEQFVAATGVDALAVAVGSAHAMTTRTAVVDVDLIRRLRSAVPRPLVLHGSSGVPDASLRNAVAAGIVKVNIGTALNVAFTAAVRQQLSSESDIIDPRRYLGPAREAMVEVVAASLLVLSS